MTVPANYGTEYKIFHELSVYGLQCVNVENKRRNRSIPHPVREKSLFQMTDNDVRPLNLLDFLNAALFKNKGLVTSIKILSETFLISFISNKCCLGYMFIEETLKIV